MDSLGRSERARGEGEREHIRRDENAGTKRGSREDLWHGRLGILEETTESGGEKVLGLFERRKDDLLRGRSACPPREMVADNAPKQPQNQENLYFDAICTANSICAESQRSTERYCEKIFQRAGEITNPAADDEGSRLQQSVFTAYAAGRGSLDVPCCLDANEDGRTAFGCEELDWREREGGHQQGSEVIGDSVIQKKDRPSWRLPSSAHPWPNPAGQKNLARDDPSVEGAGPACNLAISKPCQELQRLKKKAGIKSFIALRRARAQRAAKIAPMTRVAELLGHRPGSKSTQCYVGNIDHLERKWRLAMSE